MQVQVPRPPRRFVVRKGKVMLANVVPSGESAWVFVWTLDTSEAIVFPSPESVVRFALSVGEHFGIGEIT